MAPYSRNCLRARLARNAHTRGVYVRNSSDSVRRTGVVQSQAVRASTPPPTTDATGAKDDSGSLTVGLVHFVSTSPCEETIEAAGTIARKQDMALHEVTPQNVKHASTLTLLRIRARDVRAQYVRMWRCYTNNHVQPFVYDSHEGNGNIDEKISNLRKYIIDHIKVIENLRILVDRCKTSRSRLKRANRSGGYLTRLLRERNGAVVDELMARYEMTVGKVVNNLDGGTKCDTLPTRVQLYTQPLSPMRLKVVKKLLCELVAHRRKLPLLLFLLLNQKLTPMRILITTGYTKCRGCAPPYVTNA